MMKLLLAAINAKYIHSNPAVYSLRAYAGQGYENIAIAEYSVNERTEDILADIFRRGPEVVAFSCYIWNMETVSRILPELHKLLPETAVWLGGPEVSFRCAKLLNDYQQVTGIMVGEGEATFADLCAFYFEKKGSLKDIKGLWLQPRFGNGNAPFYTGDREPLTLSELPFLYPEPEKFANRIIYYESQRGCPFRCSYCLSSVEKSVRLKPTEQVLSELQHLLDCRVPQVKFVDRTFNCNHEHACTIWRYLTEHDNGVTNFHFEIAADILTDEEMEILASLRPGLFQLEIGIQSTNPDTIRAVNRTMDWELVAERVHSLVAFHNMHIHVDLIAGLPYEGLESFRKSYDDVFALGAEMLQLGFLKVLHGAPIEENAGKYGIICQDIPPYEVLYTKWLTFADILELKSVEEMTEIYYNSNQYRFTLRWALKGAESPYGFFHRLAVFYRENGYTVNQPSRMKRYDVLREFLIKDSALTDTELLDELLTVDLYLRENCKSRPAFARALKPYREFLSGKESTNVHEEVFFYDVFADEPKSGKPIIVQFHYDKRDALTNNASVSYRR